MCKKLELCVKYLEGDSQAYITILRNKKNQILTS